MRIPPIFLLIWGLIVFFISSAYADDAASRLANYIGTGSDPQMILELSDNGPNWASYTIDYQKIGNIPDSSEPSDDWSVWNVIDNCDNYYGSVTLENQGPGYTASYKAKAPATGFYLENVTFSYNTDVAAYQLTVEKIHRGNTDCISPDNPFPNTPPAQPAVYSDTETKITLSANGAHIVNDRNEVIILKGLVRPSLEWNDNGQYLSAQDINNMQGWKPNVIRLNLNQNFWFKSDESEGSYKQIIDALIYHAIQNNMAVILDLHWVEDGHQSAMPNKDSIRFWKEVSGKYKDFGTVIFELYNEPTSVTPKVWLEGDATYVGHQALYDAVRKDIGATNLVIINGLDWGYDLSFVNDNFKVIGDNIIYGAHPYNKKGSDNHSGPGGSLDNNLKGVLGKYPLIFTEFGVNMPSYFPNGYQEVYQRNLAYMTEHNISYTAFAWWVENDPNKANVFPAVVKDWFGTPLNGGVYINDDMRNAPGAPIAGN